MQRSLLTSLVLWILAIAVTVVRADEPSINGPGNAAAGDLVILDASGLQADQYVWKLVNSDKSYLEFEDNTKLVFASGKSGEYIFCLAASWWGDGDEAPQLVLIQHVLQIGAPGPNVPEPVVPDPIKPDVPNPPDPLLTGLALEAFEQAVSDQLPAGEIQQLASNLRTVSSKAAGLSWSAQKMSEELRKANSSEGPFNTDDSRQRWTPFAKWFAAAMSGASTRDRAAGIMNDIAEGLEAAAERSTTMFQEFRDVPNETLKDMLNRSKTDLQNIQQEIGN